MGWKFLVADYGGARSEKQSRRRKEPKKLVSRLTSHLLALDAAGDDAGSVVPVAILHVRCVRHVDLLRRVASQLDGIPGGT